MLRLAGQHSDILRIIRYFRRRNDLARLLERPHLLNGGFLQLASVTSNSAGGGNPSLTERFPRTCPPCSRMFLFAIRPQLRCPASSLLRPKKALQTRVSRLLDILDNKDEVGRVIFVWPACRLRQSTHRRSILRRPAAVCHPPAHPPFRLFRSTPVCLIG
jgi:hypothetical protein